MSGPLLAQSEDMSIATVSYKSTEGEADEFDAIGPYLIVSLCADRPYDRPRRIALSGAERVHLCRGPVGAVERVVELGDTRVCRVVLADSAMSACHATIVVTESGDFLLQDDRSKNGTTLNGDQVSGPAELFDGDVISVGTTFLLFRCSNDVSRTTATPVSSTDEFSSLHPGVQRTLDRLAILATSNQPILIVGPQGAGRRYLARAVHARSGRRGGLVESSVDEAIHSDDVPTGTRIVRELGVADAGPVEHLLERDTTRGERLILIGDGHLESALSPRACQLAPHRFELPPLILRAEDIGPLIALFLRENGSGEISLRRSAARALLLHLWPGNIGELKAAIQFAIPMIEDDTVRLRDLPQPVQDVEASAKQRRMLIRLLSAHVGNVSAVARELGLSRPSVYELAKRFGINVSAFRDADG